MIDLDDQLRNLDQSLEELSLDHLKKRKERIWNYYQKLKSVISFKEEMENYPKDK